MAKLVCVFFSRLFLHGSLRVGMCSVPSIRWFTCSLFNSSREFLPLAFEEENDRGQTGVGQEGGGLSAAPWLGC